MKNIFKILSLVVFVVLMSSCQKEDGIIIPQNKTDNQFKAAGEDDIVNNEDPVILGHFSITDEERALGVRVELKNNSNTTIKSTNIDTNGNYLFSDLLPGTYTRNVIIGEEIVSSIVYMVFY